MIDRSRVRELARSQQRANPHKWPQAGKPVSASRRKLIGFLGEIEPRAASLVQARDFIDDVMGKLDGEWSGLKDASAKLGWISGPGSRLANQAMSGANIGALMELLPAAVEDYLWLCGRLRESSEFCAFHMRLEEKRRRTRRNGGITDEQSALIGRLVNAHVASAVFYNVCAALCCLAIEAVEADDRMQGMLAELERVSARPPTLKRDTLWVSSAK